MDKFGPETKVRFECEKCDKVELVRLGDMRTTPKGTFILPLTVQCVECLGVVDCIVRDEDQE